jgi:arylsulfatase A-like enzyme
LGLLSRTWFVLTSDNGYHMGQHRLTYDHGGGKETAFDEDVHLPLFVRGPGVKPGLVVNRLVTLADLAPTFAAWAGTEPGPKVDGRSIDPLLRPGAPKAWRNWLPLRHLKPSRVDQTHPAQTFLGVRTARYSYVEYPEFGLRDLYDMRADPAQSVNVASSADPALLDRLGRITAALATCSRSTCRMLEDAPAP